MIYKWKRASKRFKESFKIYIYDSILTPSSTGSRSKWMEEINEKFGHKIERQGERTNSQSHEIHYEYVSQRKEKRVGRRREHKMNNIIIIVISYVRVLMYSTLALQSNSLSDWGSTVYIIVNWSP